MDWIDEADQIDLVSLKAIEDENDEKIASANIGKTVGTGAAIYGGSAVLYNRLKYSPIGPAIGRIARKTSTKVEGFYDPGAEKKKLMVNHLLKNEQEEIQKVIKNHAPELKIKSPEEAEAIIKNKMKDWGHQSVAEHRAWLDEAKFLRKREDRALRAGAKGSDLRREAFRKQGGKAVTLAREIRHERLAQEMIDWTESGVVNVKRLEQNGLSKPIVTDMKTAFGISEVGSKMDSHSRVTSAWGGNLDKNSTVSISQILDVGGDKGVITKSVRRDHIYQMGEYVTAHADDLTDLKEVRKLATVRFNSMIGDKAFGATMYNRLHPHLGDRLVKDWDGTVKKEVDRFMNTFRYNKKTGIVNIMYSPNYKPHYLVGGVNASVNFRKSTGTIGRNIGTLADPTSRVGIPSRKVYNDILISDRYDVLTDFDPFQRKVHFNVVSSRDVKRVPRSLKFNLAMKEKKYGKAAKHGAKWFMKRAMRLALFRR